VISFKIPSTPIDKGEGRFFTHWDPDKLLFTVQLFFASDKQIKEKEKAATAGGPAI
jgi:splicing factor 3A subunit 2